MTKIIIKKLINKYSFNIHYKMSDKEKGFVKEITDFFKQSKNFITNCQKPDKKGKFINHSFMIYFYSI